MWFPSCKSSARPPLVYFLQLQILVTACLVVFGGEEGKEGLTPSTTINSESMNLNSINMAYPIISLKSNITCNIGAERGRDDTSGKRVDTFIIINGQ